MPLAAGTRVGPYEVVAPLGRGGMGEVFRARDTRLGRTVALKILPRELSRDASAVERFKREARAASTISHPYVCSIYDTGEYDGTQYLVMELLEGASLQGVIRQGPLEIGQVLDLAVDIAEGLQAAHDKGIIHRDLKPANLFITTQGHAKILDFGVAKLSELNEDMSTVAALTGEGRAVGTAAYMAPEQARGLTVDARSDLFSLGVVFYEMLTRKPAFTGPTTAVIFDALMHRQPPPVRELCGNLPGDLERIVSRLLAKAPEARYQTTRELVADLRAAQIAHATRSGPGATAASTPQSVAVLPFAGMSSDPDSDYFADGVTEEVINALGRVKELRVPGRMSSFAFKGKTPDVAEVAAKLNVATVLTGSVRKSGNRLRITAELVNASDGFQLWSERYDRTADDIFAIQDEIATRIVERLRITLSPPTTHEPHIRRPTTNLEAYNSYLKGRFFLNQRGEGIAKGLDAFQRALTLDPEFALAHSGIAEAFSLLGFYGYKPGAEILPVVRASAERALAIDPTLAEPHATLHVVHSIFEWDWAKAAREFDLAMAKNPNTVTALNFRVVELATVHGQFDGAVGLASRAIDIDPLSPYSHVALATALLSASRYDECIASAERALELHPGMWAASRLINLAYSRQGQHDQAIAWAERSMAYSQDHPWTLMDMADALVRAGRVDDARAKAHEILAMSKTRFVQHAVMGMASAIAIDLDAAFAWFERTVDEHDLLPLMNNFAAVKGTRTDPRWAILMRRIGVEPRTTD